MPQGAGQGKSTSGSLKYDEGALIALGSNLTSSFGTPNMTLRKALESLEERGAVIRAVSRMFRTPAFPPGSGPDFVNAAAFVQADWSPARFLAELHQVEADLGRVRTERWGQRVVDLDLLAMDDLVLPDRKTHQYWRNLSLNQQKAIAPDDLILPHPRIQERAFVLVPLCDIAPEWQHPVLGLTARQLCDSLPLDTKSEVIPLD